MGEQPIAPSPNRMPRSSRLAGCFVDLHWKQRRGSMSSMPLIVIRRSDSVQTAMLRIELGELD
jgi:hypothetical protein